MSLFLYPLSDVEGPESREIRRKIPTSKKFLFVNKLFSCFHDETTRYTVPMSSFSLNTYIYTHSFSVLCNRMAFSLVHYFPIRFIRGHILPPPPCLCVCEIRSFRATSFHSRFSFSYFARPTTVNTNITWCMHACIHVHPITRHISPFPFLVTLFPGWKWNRKQRKEKKVRQSNRTRRKQ